jgi:hypothetical protein
LSDAASAIRMLDERRAHGKILIRVGGGSQAPSRR